MNYPTAFTTKWVVEEKYRDRYRVPSARLPGFRYTASGWYFITICTRSRAQFLSNVSEGKIELTDAGQIVREEWLRTQNVRPYVVLDEWVIMPDHFHGLIGIANPPVETSRRDVSGNNQFDHARETPQRGVSGNKQSYHARETPRRGVSGNKQSYRKRETPQRGVSTGANRPRLVAHSLGAIIGQFKSICTKRIRANGMPHFAWQSRFYDRIVRNEHEFERIRDYIIANPQNWKPQRHRRR